jgi:hypothetical protein
MWRRLEATLVYDSRQQAHSIGVRAAGTRPPRLLYTAGGFEISVQIRPGSPAGRYRLVGEVLDDAFEPTSGSVTLKSPRESVTMQLDDCAHFSIDGLAAGSYRFEVGLPHALIVIPSVYV